MSLSIRVGIDPGVPGSGRWLHHIGYHGDVKKVDRYPFGNWSLTWSMDLGRARPKELTWGTWVEGWVGACRIWRGWLDEPNWADGEFSASGSCRQAEGIQALGFDGKATSDPGAAIGAAALWRGTLRWGSLTDFTAAGLKPLPAATSTQRLDAVLNSWCELNGHRWSVDADGLFWLGLDPTAPSRFISASAGQLGVTTEVQATHLYGGYYSAALDYPPPVQVTGAFGGGFGAFAVEELVDLTPRGPMTMTDALATTEAIYAQAGGGLPQFTGSLTVRAGQVTNRGGVPIDPVAMGAGQMYRIQGMPDARTGALSTDVIMGEAAYDETAGTATLTPLNAVRQDIASITEQIVGAA